MLPIFENYRKMLNDTCGLDLSEYDNDKLWVDRLIIRGFNKQGKDIKICRLSVSDDLEYSYKFYSKLPKNEDLMTWEEIYLFFENDILAKEAESIQVTKDMIAKYPGHNFKLSTSFGKDSVLLETIIKKALPEYKNKMNIVFYNTTMDTGFNYRIAKQNNIPIITSKDNDGNYKSFYNMLKDKEVPHRTYRWCCSEFKENNAIKTFKKENNILFFLGMRNEESAKRADYQFEKEDDRFNKTWHFILPIRKWTEFELWLYTIHNNLFINQKYKQGYKRCGCLIVCPFASKTDWILDKYYYSYNRKRYEGYLEKDFVKGEKWTIHNCTLSEYIKGVWAQGGIVREEPTDEVIQEFIEYKGITDKNIAMQYFNKSCECCGKRVYKKDEVAMNLKMFGREINKFKCKKCLMKEFDWTKEDWNAQVDGFKSQGCKLF